MTTPPRSLNSVFLCASVVQPILGETTEIRRNHRDTEGHRELKEQCRLDGTITEAPKFFAAWTQSWLGRVIIITYRNDREKTIADLEHHQIRYDELVLVDRMDGKAAVIAEHGVTMYVDDQPAMLKNVPAGVSVMLFRNEGNFDFTDRRWMFSD